MEGFEWDGFVEYVGGIENRKEINELLDFFDFPFKEDLMDYIKAFPPDFENGLGKFRVCFIRKAKELIFFYAFRTRHLITDSPDCWQNWLQGIPLLPVHIEEVLDKVCSVKRPKQERQEIILRLLKGWLDNPDKDSPRSSVPDAGKWVAR